MKTANELLNCLNGHRVPIEDTVPVFQEGASQVQVVCGHSTMHSEVNVSRHDTDGKVTWSIQTKVHCLVCGMTLSAFSDRNREWYRQSSTTTQPGVKMQGEAQHE